MLWGQQNVIVTEKQLSDLSLMTNEALKQKVDYEIGCTCIGLVGIMLQHSIPNFF